MDNNLLLDRLENLRYAKASNDEILRQMEQYPQLTPGEILRRAEMLLNQNRPLEELKAAHQWLEPLFSLETSYCTSSGPIATTHEAMTVWEHPPRPFWGTTFILLAVFLVAGVIGYRFEMPNLVILSAAGALFSVVLYAGLFRAVAMNAWEARRELDEKIIGNAKRLESIIEEAHRVPA